MFIDHEFMREHSGDAYARTQEVLRALAYYVQRDYFIYDPEAIGRELQVMLAYRYSPSYSEITLGIQDDEIFILLASAWRLMGIPDSELVSEWNPGMLVKLAKWIYDWAHLTFFRF